MTELPETGRSWRMLAPVLKQKSPKRVGSLADYFRSDPSSATFSSFDMFWMLSSRIPAQNDLSTMNILSSKRSGYSSAEISRLESLPNEMLQQLLNSNDLVPQDILNLGACSRRLLAHALTSAQTKFASASGRWANTPLFCPCYLTRDLAPAIYELLPQVRAAQTRYPKGYPALFGYVADPPAQKWVREAFLNFETFSDQGTERRRWFSALEAILEAQLLPAEAHSNLRHLLSDALRVELPLPGEEWILRNLRTKEYIRFNITESTEEEIKAHIAGVPWLSLDVAFLIRTFWCHWRERIPKLVVDRNLFSEYGKYGMWAGHRFDIVRRAEQGSLGTWIDATGELVTSAMRDLNLERVEHPITPEERAKWAHMEWTSDL